MMWVSIAGSAPGGHAGGSRRQVPLGDRFFFDCRAFPSRRACGVCSPDLPLAGFGLAHDVSDLAGCTEDPANTLDTIDNRSATGKRVVVIWPDLVHRGDSLGSETQHGIRQGL